jgi:hypothetical protein
MFLGRLQNRLSSLSLRALGLAGATLAAVLAVSGDAGAYGPVEVTGKGIVGGALLGGEVVTITMGAAGLRKGWPYFVFGGVGMVGGAIGGYYVEKKTAVVVNGSVQSGGPAEPAMLMLAFGMGLVIPALVISLNATAYKPPESDRTEPANNEPASDSPKPSPAPAPAAAPAPTSHNTRYKAHFRSEIAEMPHIPTSLLDMYRGKLALGVPAVAVQPLYSQSEMWKYGVAQGTEVRLPVFKATF